MRLARWPRAISAVNEETPPEDIVVLGGGVAGHRCVTDMRRFGYRGKLTMIGKENLPPYDRTMLSKDMLHDGALPGPVTLSEIDRYREADIDLRLGVAAEWLDVERRRIGLTDATTRSFDRLVLCVGGRPVLPPALDAPGVIVVREAAGLDRLRAAMVAGTRMVVIGGGFIGGEVAAAASGHGVEVTLVEAAAQPLEPVLGAEVGARVAALHRDHGVKVLTERPANSVVAQGKGFAVRFADGTELTADHVVVGVGMTPETDWLEKSGIELDDGIVTDANCRASLAPVFAAGDCARWWHSRYGELCRVEHWDTANRHGAAAARAVLGERTPFAPLPFFWSDQHGVKFQWAGRAPTWDELRIEGDSPSRFVARYFLDGDLAGVLAAGQPRVFAGLRRELIHSVPAGEVTST